MNDVVRLDAVSKVYGRGPNTVFALREVSVGIPHGSFTAVMGPSGSGKSTFLHCAAGLDQPSSGSVRLGGTELAGMNETELTELRRKRIGFVFQAFNLVSSLTVTENITLPLRLAGVRVDRAWLEEIVDRVGLAGRTGHRPGELSGGQQQRVAIARALVTRPEVVFGDEPTGALDTMTARDVLTLLREVVTTMRQTVVMVTHDPVAASYADTVLFLADGNVVDAMAAPSAEKVADRMTRLGAWV
ncbi:ABC transporter ATP-binding protein [Streptosporangium roseum]|uniref:ABC transporter related protein n=1 Tax=Streptosporangium roseum (strain ATCC 12428 / DSM 43021 / JCM 3005 / KCTC 9067 / NCIMB 10171 / NRRL 2505 / NI 9100) TaxID=479432 RepID=D2AXG6_STRRD|nr:ABC transporter ATP-binding protein [Streptosporangium roseum]ACZ83146.1 ABC transporter related protein [Streptosporangium roseum DSM 43021]